MMGEILGYLQESLESSEIPPEPADAPGRALYERLQIADLAGQLSVRVNDLRKNVVSAKDELGFLRGLASIVGETRMHRYQQVLQENSRTMLRMHETHQRVASLLEVLALMMSGIIAFAILDRITGQWSVMDAPWMKDFAEPMITNSPILWFFFNMVFWGAVAYGLYRLLVFWEFQYNGQLQLRIRIMKRYRPDRFNTFLESKPTAMEQRDAEHANTSVRISWDEPDFKAFGGSPPRILLEYDAETEFIHYITILYNRRAAKRDLQLESIEIRNRIAADLKDAGVFEDAEYSFREEPRVIFDEDDELGIGKDAEMAGFGGIGEAEADLAKPVAAAGAGGPGGK
jgi:WD repeat-containing protein 35